MLTPPSRHAYGAIILLSVLANISTAQPPGPSSRVETCILVDPLTRIITSFDQLANFQTCTTINIRVSITDANLVSLDLHNIEEFKYIFELRKCKFLKTITGLNLTTIQSNFILNDLPLLDTLELPRLRSVGEIWWEHLPQLRSIPSVDPLSVNISSPAGSIDYYDGSTVSVSLTGLERFDFFSIPTVIDNDLSAEIEITQNPNLAVVKIGILGNPSTNVRITGNGASNIEDTQLELTGLQKVGNMHLTHIAALDLPYLTTITESFDLSHSSVTNISFPSLAIIRGNLNLVKNPLLATVSLPSLHSVNKNPDGTLYLQVLDNPLLYSLSLPSLESVTHLIISNNSQLAKIDLQNLKTIGNNFRVLDNPMLLELDGFKHFEHAYGEMEFVGNFSSIVPRPPKPGNREQERLAYTSIRIHAYNPLFSCDTFRYNYNLPTYTDGGTFYFTCITPVPPITIPTPESESEPNKKGLTKEVAAVLIAVAVFGGIVCYFIGRVFLKRKKAEELRVQQYNIELAAVRAAADAAGDGDGDGVVRTVALGEEGDGLPAYSRVAKPEEIPPEYREIVVEEGGVAATGNGNGVVADGRRTRGS